VIRGVWTVRNIRTSRFADRMVILVFDLTVRRLMHGRCIAALCRPGAAVWGFQV
jgi:hypothetical protein